MDLAPSALRSGKSSLRSPSSHPCTPAGPKSLDKHERKSRDRRPTARVAAFGRRPARPARAHGSPELDAKTRLTQVEDSVIMTMAWPSLHLEVGVGGCNRARARNVRSPLPSVRVLGRGADLASCGGPAASVALREGKRPAPSMVGHLTRHVVGMGDVSLAGLCSVSPGRSGASPAHARATWRRGLGRPKGRGANIPAPGACVAPPPCRTRWTFFWDCFLGIVGDARQLHGPELLQDP